MLNFQEENEESRLRDFWKKKTYEKFNEAALKNFQAKLFATRLKKWKRIRMKNYRYI